MRHLALLTPNSGKTPADFAPLIVQEEVALWSMYRQDIVREMHFDPSELTVSLVFETATKTDVEAALQNLPMVRSGLFAVNLVRQGPWLPVEALFDSAAPTSAQGVVSEIYEAVARADWTAVLERIDTEIVVEQSSALPFAGLWRGHEGFQKLGEKIYQTWPDFKVEPQTFFGAGEMVLVLTRVSGRGDVPLDQTMIEFWRVRGGKAVECRPFYFDPLAATKRNPRPS